MFCTNCGSPISESDHYCKECGYKQIARFYPVSNIKFILLNLASANLYLLYWFYSNWSYIKQRDHSDISPVLRSIFSNLLCYSFLSDLRSESDQEHGKPEPNALAVLLDASLAILFFFLLTVSWRFPDPYFLISFFSFAPLLPAVNDIKKLNSESSYHYKRNSKLLIRHYVLILIAILLISFVIIISFGLIPSSSVVAGRDLSKWQVEIIREFSRLHQNERIIYYYSNALFSYEDDGNIVTDNRVVSYYIDEMEVRYISSADFREISDLHVLSGTFFEPTLIVACLDNGEFVALYASTEEHKDLKFVDAIKSRLRHEAKLIVEQDQDFACE